MAVVLVQDWDIIMGMEDQYQEFITNTYLPNIEKLRLKSIGGFYVVVGFGPNIISLKQAESLNELTAIMSTQEFKDLHCQLREYVVNYRCRIMEPTGRVKHTGYKIHSGDWKLNTYWDLVPGRKEEYSKFIINEYLPTIEKLDYVEITGGWNVIVGGFCDIIAEFTFQSPVDIGRLFENDDYKNLTRILRKNFTVNFNARILRATERFEVRRWYTL
jgi:hypothetical protein